MRTRVKGERVVKGGERVRGHILAAMATQSDDEKRNSPASEDEVMEAIDLPHGPKPWPVVGNMPHVGFLGERPFAYNIGEMFAKYGDIFTLKLDMLGGVDDQDKCGGVLPIFIADPAIVQELVLREKEFPKMWTSKINKSISFLGGKGLFTSSTVDREWQTARPLMSKPFNEVKIKQVGFVLLLGGFFLFSLVC